MKLSLVFIISLQFLATFGGESQDQVTSKRPRVEYLVPIKSEPLASDGASTPALPDMDSDGEVECVGKSAGLSWQCRCGKQNDAFITAKHRAVAPPVCATCGSEREQPAVDRSPPGERILPNADLDTVIWERWLTEQERKALKMDTRWKPVHYTLQFKLEHAFLAGKDGIEYRIDTSTGAVVDSTSSEKLDEILFTEERHSVAGLGDPGLALPRKVKTITFQAKKELGIRFKNGGVIPKVYVSGQAASLGVRVGWVITQISGKDIAKGTSCAEIGKVFDAVIAREKTFDVTFNTEHSAGTPGRPMFSVRFGVYQQEGQMRQSDLPNNSWLTSLQTNKQDPSRSRYLRRRIKLANIALPSETSQADLEATLLAKWADAYWVHGTDGRAAIRFDVTKGKGSPSQGAGASSQASGAAEGGEIRVDEWAAVEALFLSRGMARQSAEVVRIERIQHPGMADAFDGYAHPPAMLRQHWLWHGTKKEHLAGIAQSGLSTRLTGAKHTFGKGGYFAAQPSYSHNFHYAQPYTDHNGQKVQTIVLARVKVGLSKPGTADVATLPPFGEFDSTSDRDQSIFVVYNDLTHSYPCYFVTYTVPDGVRKPGAVIAARPPESSGPFAGFVLTAQQKRTRSYITAIVDLVARRLRAAGHPGKGTAEANKALLEILNNFQLPATGATWAPHATTVRTVVGRIAAAARSSADPFAWFNRLGRHPLARAAALSAAAAPPGSATGSAAGAPTATAPGHLTASSSDKRIQGRPQKRIQGRPQPWQFFQDIDAAATFVEQAQHRSGNKAKANILKVCQGRYSQCGGWEWRYVSSPARTALQRNAIFGPKSPSAAPGPSASPPTTAAPATPHAAPSAATPGMEARLSEFGAGAESSAAAQLEVRRVAALQGTIQQAAEGSSKRSLDATAKTSEKGDGEPPSKKPKGDTPKK